DRLAAPLATLAVVSVAVETGGPVDPLAIGQVGRAARRGIGQGRLRWEGLEPRQRLHLALEAEQPDAIALFCAQETATGIGHQQLMSLVHESRYAGIHGCLRL